MMRAGWVLGNASGEVVLKVDMWPETNQPEAEVYMLLSVTPISRNYFWSSANFTPIDK